MAGRGEAAAADIAVCMRLCVLVVMLLMVLLLGQGLYFAGERLSPSGLENLLNSQRGVKEKNTNNHGRL